MSLSSVPRTLSNYWSKKLSSACPGQHEKLRPNPNTACMRKRLKLWRRCDVLLVCTRTVGRSYRTAVARLWPDICSCQRVWSTGGSMSLKPCAISLALADALPKPCHNQHRCYHISRANATAGVFHAGERAKNKYNHACAKLTGSKHAKGHMKNHLLIQLREMRQQKLQEPLRVQVRTKIKNGRPRKKNALKRARQSTNGHRG